MAAKTTSEKTETENTPNLNSPVSNEQRYTPEKELMVWNTQSRPFKRRSRDYWVIIMSIAGLLAFILFLAEGLMPVLMIISLVFLYYVLSTVPPHEVAYKITNLGIKVQDNRTDWDFLIRWWFEKKLDSDVLVVESVNFPGKLELVVNNKDMEKIRQIMLKYLPEDKPAETALDRATTWVTNKLPQK